MELTAGGFFSGRRPFAVFSCGLPLSIIEGVKSIVQALVLNNTPYHAKSCDLLGHYLRSYSPGEPGKLSGSRIKGGMASRPVCRESIRQ